MGHGNGYDDYGTCGCETAECVCDADHVSICPANPYAALGRNDYSPVWDLTQYIDATEDVNGNPVALPPCGWWRISAPHNNDDEIEAELKPYLITGRFDANGRFINLPERIETDKVLYLDFSYGRCYRFLSGYTWGSCGFPNYNYSACEGLVNGTYSTEEFIGEGVVAPKGRWQLTHSVAGCGRGNYCSGSGGGTSDSYRGYVSNMGELVGLPLLGGTPGETTTLVHGDTSFANCTGGQANTATRNYVRKELYRLNALHNNDADPGGHVLDLGGLLGPGIGTPGRCWQIVLTGRCSSSPAAVFPGFVCVSDGSYCSGKAKVTLLSKTGEPVNEVQPSWSGIIVLSGTFAADGSMAGLEQGMELVIEPPTGVYTRRCDWYNVSDSCYLSSYYHLIAELLYEEWTVT